MTRPLAVAAVLLLGAPAFAADGQTPAPPISLAPGIVHPAVPAIGHPGHSYALYLPRAYDPRRRWPVLLCFEPRSRATLVIDLFRESAEERGWILVSSNDTMSDVEGGPDPNFPAMRALWEDTHARLSVDPRRVYAVGFSGTARAAWLLALARAGEVAGLIAVGAGLPPALSVERAPPVAAFLAAGEEDFNHAEVRALDRALEERGFDHRFEPFPGGHVWLPAGLAAEGLRWFDLLAIRDGVLPRDPAFEAAERDRALAAAAARERDGDALGAWRIHRRLEADLRGLGGGDTAPALARLAGSEVLAAQRERELREERERLQFRERSTVALARALADPQPSALPGLLRDLRVAELRQRAEGPPPERLAARRLLANLLVQTWFYLPRKMVGEGRLGAAELCLRVALEIEPHHAGAWYSLAAVHARARQRRAALAALERAVAEGFGDAEALASDEAFTGLRTDDRFTELLRRLRAAKPAEPAPAPAAIEPQAAGSR